jgi:hypothetical protein
MALHQKVTGAWVDGFPVPVEQAGRLLRGFLSEGDFVTVVVADARDEPHSVTLSGTPARRMAELAKEPNELVAEPASDAPHGQADAGSIARHVI